MLLLAAFVMAVWLGAVVVAVYRYYVGQPSLHAKPTFRSSKYGRDPRVPAHRGHEMRITKHVDPTTGRIRSRVVPDEIKDVH